jgi:hypothetical protein
MFPRKIRDEVVYVAEGRLQAESIKLLLESFGITAFINQESAGTTYGLTVGFLGEVEVIVPLDQVEDAKKIIADMEAGNLEDSSELQE